MALPSTEFRSLVSTRACVKARIADYDRRAAKKNDAGAGEAVESEKARLAKIEAALKALDEDTFARLLADEQNAETKIIIQP